jgi:transcriptional regulator with XRE-family HTH domain
MSPDPTKELITDLRAWYEDHDVSQKNLARKLYLTPQQLSELFAGRNRPTGDQVLRIQEFLRTNMRTDYIDPRTKPRPTASNPGPKTLTEARERIEVLEAQLRGSGTAPKPAAPASPTGKAKAAAGDPGADPTYPPVGTPGADRLAPTPMPVGVPAVKKAALSEAAVSPVLCQRELDVADFETVLSMLGNPIHNPMQQACIYAEVKKRRALVSNRFQ